MTSDLTWVEHETDKLSETTQKEMTIFKIKYSFYFKKMYFILKYVNLGVNLQWNVRCMQSSDQQTNTWNAVMEGMRLID